MTCFNKKDDAKTYNNYRYFQKYITFKDTLHINSILLYPYNNMNNNMNNN